MCVSVVVSSEYVLVLQLSAFNLPLSVSLKGHYYRMRK